MREEINEVIIEHSDYSDDYSHVSSIDSISDSKKIHVGDWGLVSHNDEEAYNEAVEDIIEYYRGNQGELAQILSL